MRFWSLHSQAERLGQSVRKIALCVCSRLGGKKMLPTLVIYFNDSTIKSIFFRLLTVI